MEKRLPFYQQLRYERKRRGWSQAEVASRVGIDTKTVARWERGLSHPRHYHSRALCELFEKDVEEFGLLDKNVYDPIIRPEGPDSITARETLSDVIFPVSDRPLTTFPSKHLHHTLLNWGEAPHIESFFGRETELDTLKRWLLDLYCRVVTVFGMGGMGKTTLVAYLVAQIQDSFDYVFWRSVQNAPPLEYILKQCIQFLTGQQSIDLPELVDDQISLLIQYLREYRCLLVLDNAETLLQAEQRVGQYREGYENYGTLIRRVGEAQHRSCLLLTSREQFREIALLEGKTKPVQSLHLSGVRYTEGQEILKDKELFGSDEQWKALVDRYSGNPLALKLVAEYIKELFEGNIALFLKEEEFVFGNINDLLDQQFRRLFKQEQEILFWLAIEREATSIEKIYENMVGPTSKGALLEALHSLQRRSLTERRGLMGFFLQPVVMEYVTDRLTKAACQELICAELDIWANYAFVQAQTTDYVRENQERFILQPIAEHLVRVLGKEGIEQKLKSILSTQRQIYSQQHCYIAGNALNLLTHLQSNLRGLDFSSLTIREACLQGVSLPDVNFARAYFMSSVFRNTFGNILSVAFSSQGRLLATGTATGDIWIYQVARGIPLCICSGHTDGVWSVTFSSDEQILFSSSDDQTIRIWDVSTGHCLRALHGHTNRVRSLALSPNNLILVSGSDDETIRVWEVSTGRCLRILQEHVEQDRSAAFRVWSVAFSYDGTLLASGNTDGTISLWDTSEWHFLKKLYGHTGAVRSVTLGPDGTTLASGSDDQTVRLWDIRTDKCTQTLQGHRNRVWSIAFSSDGHLLASGSEDHTVRLWDAHNYLGLKILQNHTSGVRSVAFSPDAQTLVSGGEDQTVRLWDVKSGYGLQMLQGYTNRIRSIAFSPDGCTLVSGCEDQTICLWDVNAGNCLYTLQPRSHGVKSVAFSGNGKTFASGGEDQAIHLWDASTGQDLVYRL
jgi:WD40 repeat protein/transcriptional regulator with XRE-family HTH domain